MHHRDSQGEVPLLPKALGYKKCKEHLASLVAVHSSRGYLFLKKTQSQDGKWNSASSHHNKDMFLYFRVEVTQYFLFSVKGFSTHLRRNNLM